MTSSLDQRDQMLAAEYALGALDGALLAEAQKRYEDEIEFRHEVDNWSERMQPLLESVPAVVPAPQIFAQIENRLGFDAAKDRTWVSWLQNKIMVAGLAFGLLIMAILVGVNLMPQYGGPSAPILTASLNIEGTTSPVSARVQNNNNEILLVADLLPLDAQDRELWLITDASPTPISLGVIEAKGETRLPIDQNIASLFAEGAVLAISLEPLGGSPSGLPTGPVVATGALVTS